MSETTSQDAITDTEIPLVLEDEHYEPVYTCHSCQCSSSFADGFQKRHRKTQSQQYTCNTCAAFSHLTKSDSSKTFNMIVLAIFAAIMFFNEGIIETASFFITYLLLTYLAIVLHELGHLSTTLILGVKVRLMTLGTGPVLKTFSIKQMMIVLKPFPWGGSVHPEFETRDHIRKKFFLIVLSGPASNLLMAIVSYIIYLNYLGHVAPLTENMLLTWAIVNAIMGVTNLFPFRIKSIAGVALSDGAHLLALPAWKDKYISNLIMENKALVAQVQLQYGDRLVARAIATDAIQCDANAHLHSGILTASANTHSELLFAAEQNKIILRSTEHEDETTAMVRNNLAYSLFLIGDKSSLPEADQQSLKAMELLPMSLAVRSTRGSVLVAMGNYDQGLALLEDERFVLESNENQAKVLCVRALAYDALGRTSDSDISRREAKTLDPNCTLLTDALNGQSEVITKAF